MKDYTIYVTEEIAKKAMEKGFECIQAFNISLLNHTFTGNGEQWYYIPTAEQICGWLRDKNLLIYTEPYHTWSQPNNWSYRYSILNLNHDYTKDSKDLIRSHENKIYNTPVEALFEGINKTLDLI